MMSMLITAGWLDLSCVPKACVKLERDLIFLGKMCFVLLSVFPRLSSVINVCKIFSFSFFFFSFLSFRWLCPYGHPKAQPVTVPLRCSPS